MNSTSLSIDYENHSHSVSITTSSIFSLAFASNKSAYFKNGMNSTPTPIGIALMKNSSKRNRQLMRDTVHLPFYERMQSRNSITTTSNSSDVDPNEGMPRHPLAKEDIITLSSQIMEKCRRAFIKCDLNCDGFIDENELKIALLRMGYNPSDSELEKIMDNIDQNGDNKLDLLEFLRLIQRQKKKTCVWTEEEKNEINIKEAWNILRDTKTGKMDVKTFKRTLKSFDLAIDIDALVNFLDADGSGNVDFAEFHEFFSEIQ